jgi:hypothetical protein
MIMQMLSDDKKSMEANYAEAYSSYFERDGVDVGVTMVVTRTIIVVSQY